LIGWFAADRRAPDGMKTTARRKRGRKAAQGKPILIICYGNPLRSDDGAAWRAAQTLSETLDPTQVEILVRHQLPPELAEAIAHSRATFFVDATPDGEAGELTVMPVHPEPAQAVFSHDLSPALLLALSQKLYKACPAAFLFTLGGQCFDHGETLSPAVAASLPRLTALVAQMARQFSH
jgi:hydrogenase maturation protease